MIFLNSGMTPPPLTPLPQISKIFSLSSILSKEVEENILQSFFYSQTENSGLRTLNDWNDIILVQQTGYGM